MNVSLGVKLSNKPPVVVKTEKRLYGFKNRHTVESEVKLFLPLKSPSLPTFQHPHAAQLVVAKHTQSLMQLFTLICLWQKGKPF